MRKDISYFAAGFSIRREPVWAACIWFFFLCAAFNIGRFVLVIEAAGVISSKLYFGLYLSLFPCAQWAVSSLAGHRLDSIRPRYYLIAAMVLMVSAWPLLSLRTTFSLVLSCVLINISSLLATLTCQKVIGQNSTARNRTANFNLFSLSGTAATLVGPALEGIMRSALPSQFSDLSYLAFIMASVLFLIWWKIDVAELVSRSAGTRAETAFKRTLRLKSAFLGGGAIFGALAVFLSYLPSTMSRYDGVAVAGLAISSYSAGSILSRLFLSRVEKRLGIDRSFGVVLGVAGVGLLAVFGTMPSLWILIASFIFGAGIGCATPLANAICHAESTSENLGSNLGSMNGFRKFGEMAILVLCALFQDGLVAGAAFLLASVFLGIAALFAVAAKDRTSIISDA